MENNSLLTGAHILYDRAVERANEVRFMVPSGESKWKEITWHETLDRTKKTALYLASKGVKRNTKVAIYAKTRVEWSWYGYGLQACGGVFVPVFYGSTPSQAAYVINHSDAEILVTEPELLPVIFMIWSDLTKVKEIILLGDLGDNLIEITLNGLNAKTKSTLTITDVKSRIVTNNEVYGRGAETDQTRPDLFEDLLAAVKSDDPSAILYTSGTTGHPKGVVLSNYNLFTNAEDWIEVLGSLIPEKKIDLLWLPTSHIFGWGELGLGNTLAFKTYFTNPVDVLSLMTEVKPTVFMSVPAYWEKLYLTAKSFSDNKVEQIEKLHELTGGELQFCLSGGAGLKREAKEFFYDAGMLIIEGYGLTECSPTLTMNRKDNFDFDTVGLPFPRVDLKLSDEGEILAKGPNVFSGYHKDPESTKAAFDSDGWFCTGDLGRFTDKGFLKITGRKKEIIVTSGGKNVSPQLIEARFKDDPYIEGIVLYGNERKFITALVTLREERIMNFAKEKELAFSNYSDLVEAPEIRSLIEKQIEEVNKDLASFETIKKFHIHHGHLTVQEGYLTSSLKLKRSEVYKSFGEKLDALY